MKAQVMFSIAKKEILDNIRNKWIIILSIIFALLTIVVSYFGSLFSQGWQDLGLTIAGMLSLVEFLIPIIALMLGYAAIIGEIERGSMSSLLALPTLRLEVVVGKFIGLACVLTVTICVGFGVAGVIIAAMVTEVNYVEYLVFIVATLLLGLVFLSLALFFSTVFKKRSTAMGGAVLLWFVFNMILPIIMSGLLVSIVGLENLVKGDMSMVPSWYYGVQLINPISVYAGIISTVIEPASMMSQGEIPVTYPDFYTPPFLFSLLVLWIVVCLALAYWRFSRKDI